MIPLLVRPEDSQGNLGDILIWHGLRRLIQMYKPDSDFLLISKFDEQALISKLDQVRSAGFLIFAGTPQYHCLSDWPEAIPNLWTYGSQFPIYSVAGGSGGVDPYQSVESFVKRCRADQATHDVMTLRHKNNPTISVRDEHSHGLLNSYGTKHQLLPCTAAWSLLGEEQSSDYLALCLPGIFHYYQSKEKPSLNELIAKFQKLYQIAESHGLNPVFVSPGKEAFAEETKYLRGYRRLCPANVLEWKSILSRASGTISCRIHVPIPMSCFPDKRLLLLPIDTRWTAAAIAGIEIADIHLSAEELFAKWLVAYPTNALIAAESKYIEAFRDFL